MIVRLTRFSRAREVLRTLGPWLALIAVLAVVNLAAATLVQGRPERIFWIAALDLALLLVGLVVLFRRHRAPRPEFELHVTAAHVELHDPFGAVLWTCPRSALTVTRELFLTHTRSGTYRNHVLGLTPSPNAAPGAAPAPLFLLNPHTLAPRSAETGRRSVAPNYAFVVAGDFERLVEVLG